MYYDCFICCVSCTVVVLTSKCFVMNECVCVFVICVHLYFVCSVCILTFIVL